MSADSIIFISLSFSIFKGYTSTFARKKNLGAFDYLTFELFILFEQI